jgi:ABC-type enterochelin transport system ATPase subunit
VLSSDVLKEESLEEVYRMRVQMLSIDGKRVNIVLNLLSVR